MTALQPGLERTLTEDGLEVRRFSDARIQSAIDGALAGVTANSAVLHIENTAEGWNAAVAANIDGHWSIAAAYAREEWGDSLGAAVKFAW